MNTPLEAYFEKSRSNEKVIESGLYLSQDDAEKASVRALSKHVVRELTNRGVPIAGNVETGNRGHFTVVPHLLFTSYPSARHVDFLIENMVEKIRSAYMLNPDSVTPIRVKFMFNNGVSRLLVIDGHIRFLALCAAIDAGANIPSITVQQYDWFNGV